MLKVVETFKSIQSEGTHAGTPATFIRLYGCNLQCNFGQGFVCDEPLHAMPNKIRTMMEVEVLAECKGIQHVVITGGEPSMNDLNALIVLLKERGHYVQVETNGLNLNNIKEANWITYSPKFDYAENAPKPSYGFQELKLLASENVVPDIEYWHSVKHKYVQPIGLEDGWDMVNVRWCHDFVVEHPGWKLSLQTHKLYGAE